MPQAVPLPPPPATRMTAAGPGKHLVSCLWLPSFIQHMPGTWHCVGTQVILGGFPSFLRERRPEIEAPSKRSLYKVTQLDVA